NTKGSTENVPLLETNAVDLALVQGEVAYEALQGVGRAPSPIRIVAAMYSTPGMFVVRADSPARTIEDLRGKPVAFGARGSGLVLLARYVLDGLGLDQERDFQAVYLDRAGDGPAMVQDGRVVALWGGGVGWPGFTAVAKAPGGGRDRSAAATGEGNHRGQYRGRRAAPRPDPSRRAALPHRARPPHALAGAGRRRHAATLSSICRACSCRCTA